MKIKKLEKDLAGRYDLSQIPEKINEIIELLNNSFITQDPDTDYGEVGKPITLSNVSCDRLTPLTNETTCELNVDHLMNMVEGGRGIYADIKCPKCGAKYFQVGPSYSTLVNYPPIIKNGVNINPDKNKCTTRYECLECRHSWSE